MLEDVAVLPLDELAEEEEDFCSNVVFALPTPLVELAVKRELVLLLEELELELEEVCR